MTPRAAMPTKADILRAMWAEYERTGLDALFAYTDPDAAWFPPCACGRVLRGHAEVREYFAALRARGVELLARADAIEEVRDRVLVRGSLRMERRGALRESTMVWAYLLEDGRVRESRAFRSRREALAALGV